MPHFHLSAQSGDDLILKRMKRRHSRADIIDFCGTVRRVRPDAAFGADLIAGFPTESEAMFENTLSLADEAGLSFLHVFPFSPRQGTPAARMPQLHPAVIKERAAWLRAKGAATEQARLSSLVGTEREVRVVINGHRAHRPVYAHGQGLEERPRARWPSRQRQMTGIGTRKGPAPGGYGQRRRMRNKKEPNAEQTGFSRPAENRPQQNPPPAGPPVTGFFHHKKAGRRHGGGVWRKP